LSLKFPCPLCAGVVVTAELAPGDMFRCPYCGGVAGVPATAAPTEDEPNLRRYVPPPKQYFEDPLPEPVEPKPLPGPTPWGVETIIKAAAVTFFGVIGVGLILISLYDITAPIFSPGISGYLDNLDSPEHLHFRNSLYIFLDLFQLWVIYYFVSKVHRNNFFNSLRLIRISRREIAKAALLALSVILLIRGIGVIFNFLGGGKYLPVETRFSKWFLTGYEAATWATVGAIKASIIEEITFRGFLFSGLKHQFGQAWAAILVSASFVAMHGSEILNPFRLIDLLIFAAVLMYVRIRSDSVTKCIVIHLVNNVLVSIAWWIHIMQNSFHTAP